MPVNAFRSQVTGITITLADDVVIGLEEFFSTYRSNLEGTTPPGTIEGLIGGILDITRTETDAKTFDGAVTALYEDYVGGKVTFRELGMLTHSLERDKAEAFRQAKYDHSRGGAEWVEEY